MILPDDIKQVFLDTLNGDKAVSDFEQWLYADKRLETILNADDYLDLIAYGYKDAHARHGLFKLLGKHIDKGELETKRIYALLTKALNRDKDLPAILKRFYDLYCEGYGFLNDLGIGYGLRVYVPFVNTYEDAWEELAESDQVNLINSFYPALEMATNECRGLSGLFDGR